MRTELPSSISSSFLFSSFSMRGGERLHIGSEAGRGLHCAFLFFLLDEEQEVAAAPEMRERASSKGKKEREDD